MKTAINIIILFIFFGSTSFSQFYTDSIISNYVIDFWAAANEVSKTFDDSTGEMLKEFSDAEINHIAELYYKAKDTDPIGFNQSIDIEYHKWEANRGKVNISKPGMRILRVKKVIAKKYGIAFAEVIGTPAFLRCKYLEWKFNKRYGEGTPHNFIFLIEDVLKGNKYFSVNDTIAVLMFPGIEAPGPDLIPGASYLVPLGTNTGFSGDNFNIVFGYLHKVYDVWDMGERPGTFLIENDTVKNCEYFGIKETSWSGFKKYFKKTYMNFKY